MTNIIKNIKVASLETEMFNKLLLTLECDTGEDDEMIGFIGFYVENDINYHINIYGKKKNGYKMIKEEYTSYKIGHDPVELVLTNFQKEVLQEFINVERERLQTEKEDKEREKKETVDPYIYFGVDRRIFGDFSY